MTGMPVAKLCEISIRSNGSRCWNGSSLKKDWRWETGLMSAKRFDGLKGRKKYPWENGKRGRRMFANFYTDTFCGGCLQISTLTPFVTPFVSTLTPFAFCTF